MFIIIDNFLDNPFKFILESKKHIKIFNNIRKAQNYPGIKVSPSEETRFILKNKIEKVLNVQNIICDEINYQFIDKNFVTGIPHNDVSKYTTILFLNPNPPKNSGVELYKKMNDYTNDLYFNQMNSCLRQKEIFFSKKQKSIFDKIKYKYAVNKFKSQLETQGERTKISNVFNRMVIFDCDIVHCAQEYFGDDYNNCRLTLTGFYK